MGAEINRLQAQPLSGCSPPGQARMRCHSGKPGIQHQPPLDACPDGTFSVPLPFSPLSRPLPLTSHRASSSHSSSAEHTDDCRGGAAWERWEIARLGLQAWGLVSSLSLTCPVTPDKSCFYLRASVFWSAKWIEARSIRSQSLPSVSKFNWISGKAHPFTSWVAFYLLL